MLSRCTGTDSDDSRASPLEGFFGEELVGLNDLWAARNSYNVKWMDPENDLDRDDGREQRVVLRDGVVVIVELDFVFPVHDEARLEVNCDFTHSNGCLVVRGKLEDLGGPEHRERFMRRADCAKQCIKNGNAPHSNVGTYFARGRTSNRRASPFHLEMPLRVLP